MGLVRRITLLTNPDVCNLCCPLCFLHQRGRSFGDITGVNGEMDFDVARRALEKYGSVVDENGNRILREVIPSTMGEPLLYSHFSELLSLCRSLCVPMNLTTNGTFPGEWLSDCGMRNLLSACSDIKVSSLASECCSDWKKNVERLLEVRRKLAAADSCAGGRIQSLATVSIQVTLHRKNLMMIPELIAWATAVGIERIKWNKVVFLSSAALNLKDEYGLDRSEGELRDYIQSCSKLCGSDLRNEGSLFIEQTKTARFSLENGNCPFAEELWIMPDGSEQHCPHPERRFGNVNSVEARCCFI